MDFRLTDEQELLLESVREFGKLWPESYWKECDEEHKFPIEFTKAFYDSGLKHLGLPEEMGGTKTDRVTQTLVQLELAKMGVPTSAVMADEMIIRSIFKYGTEEQKERCVKSIKEGRPAAALAYTEPGAGSDLQSLTTSYTRKNGKVYLNGHKTFISYIWNTDQVIVMTRNADIPETEKKMFTSWMIPTNAPGVKMRKLNKIGNHYVDNSEVYLENVEIEEKDMFGAEGNGFKQTMMGFENERLFIGINVLGMAYAAFEDSARYANQRIQFGQQIGTFQMLMEKIVDMKTKVENMYNMCMKMAWMIDDGQSVRGKVEYLKRYCCQASHEVIDDALQIFGGLGYTTDHRINRFWRDIRINRIGGGSDQIMVRVAAPAILKEYEK